jgi:hypothetical protein
MTRDALAAENAPTEGVDALQGRTGELPVVGLPFGER